MQCIGYMVLAVYLDKVLLDRMGVRLPFWYPLLPSYWKPTKVIIFPIDGSVSHEVMLPLYKMRQMVSDLQPLCIGRKSLCTPLHSTQVQKLCCQAVQWVVPLQALGMCLPACDAPILHRRTLNRCGSPPDQQTSTPTRACLVRSSPGSAVFCRQPVHSVQLQHCSGLLRRRTHPQM